MEKIIDDFSISLFLWQTFLAVSLCTIIYFLMKLYFKVMHYLESRSKANHGSDLNHS